MINSLYSKTERLMMTYGAGPNVLVKAMIDSKKSWLGRVWARMTARRRAEKMIKQFYAIYPRTWEYCNKVNNRTKSTFGGVGND